MRRPSLEICAETLQACIAARQGGADRIELCSALTEGGLTPSHGLIRRAIIESNLPVHILLRPRAGNFAYSASEFEVICSDLEHAASLGATGVVLGVLRENGTVDLQRTSRLVKLAGSLEVTFHRAFDEAPNLPEALEDVIASGCHRVLSAGGKPSANQGERVLADLVNQAAGRVRIVAGGGITVAVATALLARTDVDLHASLRRRLAVDSLDNSAILVNGASWDIEEQTADVRALAGVISSARA